MPRAATSSAIYRPDLGISVMEYVEEAAMGFIGLQLLPIFPVMVPSATYPVIPKEMLLKIQDTARAPRANYNRGDWQYERGTFLCKENGWEEPVDDDERKILEGETGSGVADFIATQRAMGIILRGQEKRIADLLFNASNFTANPVTDEWDDVVNAKPVDDVNAGVATFRTQCGMLPDALVIAYSTYVNLKSSEQIINRIKYTFPGIDINRMSSDQLAAALNVPRVIIGGAIYDAAKTGAAASITDLWSNEYAMLVKIAQRGNLTSPGLGFTFLWEADSAQNPIVEQYREEQTRGDVFRVRHNTDESLMRSKDTSGTTVSNIAGACGYLFSNITT